MADKSPDPNASTDPAAEPTAEEVQNAFFDKMEERLSGWLDREIEKRRGTGTSRGSGRPTLQGMFADLMFGTSKKD